MTVRPWLCSIALALGMGASTLTPISAAAQEPAAEPPAAPADDPAAAPNSPDAPASDPAAAEPSAPAPPATPATAEPLAEEGAAPSVAADEPPPAPGVGSYDAAEPPRTAESEPESSSTDWPYVGGWVSWGVGAAVLTVFHYAFFSLNGVARDDAMKSYRDGVLEGESSCDQARAGLPSSAAGAASPQEVADLCDEADALETLRNVTLPIGLVAALVGLVLIGTSDTVNGDAESDDQARAWRLQVGAGPRGGGATVSVSF